MLKALSLAILAGRVKRDDVPQLSYGCHFSRFVDLLKFYA
jgi:hypothetical protein